VLPPRDRQRIKGFLINKFRGDARLFDSGIEAIERHTGWQALGVIPWIKAVADLPAEDVLGVIGASSGGRIRIVVLRLARIANFDDLDPLRLEPEIDLVIVEPGRPIPADAALIIIPGSKATIADLSDLREQGWDIDIRAHLRRGGRVLGLCGGYQMLGRTVSDPQGVEGKPQTVPGLGLLDVETVLTADKTTVPVSGTDLETAVCIRGYEIHLGRTVGPDAARPLFDLVGRSDGARSADGLVSGTYVHGVFAGDEFRSAFLASFGVLAKRHYETGLEAALDALAAHLESHVDLDRILEVAGYQSRYATTDAARRSIAQAQT
jgi:adenosylcobyric acid synthase